MSRFLLLWVMIWILNNFEYDKFPYAVDTLTCNLPHISYTRSFKMQPKQFWVSKEIAIVVFISNTLGPNFIEKLIRLNLNLDISYIF